MFKALYRRRSGNESLGCARNQQSNKYPESVQLTGTENVLCLPVSVFESTFVCRFPVNRSPIVVQSDICQNFSLRSGDNPRTWWLQKSELAPPPPKFPPTKRAS